MTETDIDTTPLPAEYQQQRSQPARPGLWMRALLGRLARLEQGSLAVTLKNATLHFGRTGTGPETAITIHDERVARQFIFGGSIAVAKSYMDGDWDCTDLVALLKLAIANERALGLDNDGSWVARLVERLRHKLHANTRRGSRRNIAYHYDLGNDFYGSWLDPSMTYSSAVFSAGETSLTNAQNTKNRLIADWLELEPGHKLLEIGCGWGGFAELAGNAYHCHVTGLTLSTEQRAFAIERLARAGLAAQSDIRLEDYRDVAGSFDRIASIEMFEAVGEAHWPTYFERVRRLLAPGGIAVIQVITIAEERFAAYRRTPDFIQRYIFPGGMLPSPAALRRAAQQAGLRFTEGQRFALSYARTLAIWRERFLANWPAVSALGFDRRFKRMWEYYLAYCEAGFSTGMLDVGLFRLEPG